MVWFPSIYVFLKTENGIILPELLIIMFSTLLNYIIMFYHKSRLPKHYFIFIFIYFLATLQHMEFLGQGSDPSCRCDLCLSRGNARSFNPPACYNYSARLYFEDCPLYLVLPIIYFKTFLYSVRYMVCF